MTRVTGAPGSCTAALEKRDLRGVLRDIGGIALLMGHGSAYGDMLVRAVKRAASTQRQDRSRGAEL